jgi:cobalt-zinc-cadmium efflux system outer membrane protein
MKPRPLLLAALLAVVTPLFAATSERDARAQSPSAFPTLERAIVLARAHALNVNDAEAELGVARAQMTGARVSYFGNPYVEVQVDQGLPRSSTQELSAIAYAYFPVDVGGQRGARIDEARRLTAWREIGVNDARGVASGEAVAAYGELVVGAARITEATTGEQTARDEAKYFAGRLEAKDPSGYGKSLADAEVARWVQSRAEAELRFSAARARFSQVTGADIANPPPNVSVIAPALRGAWDDAFMALVVDRSPIVKRLGAERSYWDASVERYKAERMPPVSFELIGGRGAAGETRLGGGVVVAFPVSRRYQGEIARAEHGRANVETRLTLYRRVVETRLRAARDAIVTVNRTIEELDRAGMAALERAVSSSVEGFKTGKIEITRVLLARRDLAIARGRRLDLLEAGWRAYADLTILTGDLP